MESISLSSSNSSQAPSPINPPVEEAATVSNLHHLDVPGTSFAAVDPAVSHLTSDIEGPSDFISYHLPNASNDQPSESWNLEGNPNEEQEADFENLSALKKSDSSSIASVASFPALEELQNTHQLSEEIQPQRQAFQARLNTLTANFERVINETMRFLSSTGLNTPRIHIAIRLGAATIAIPEMRDDVLNAITFARSLSPEHSNLLDAIESALQISQSLAHLARTYLDPIDDSARETIQNAITEAGEPLSDFVMVSVSNPLTEEEREALLTPIEALLEITMHAMEPYHRNGELYRAIVATRAIGQSYGDRLATVGALVAQWIVNDPLFFSPNTGAGPSTSTSPEPLP